MTIHSERQANLSALLKDAEARVAAMHPVRRWIGWRLYFLRQALKSDRACRLYLLVLNVLLGVDLYKVPHSWGVQDEWREPRDIRLRWWHPVAWPLAVLATLLMIVVGGLELVADNGNIFRKRKNHRGKR
jgi:hypothetical protein